MSVRKKPYPITIERKINVLQFPRKIHIILKLWTNLYLQITTVVKQGRRDKTIANILVLFSSIYLSIHKNQSIYFNHLSNRLSIYKLWFLQGGGKRIMKYTRLLGNNSFQTALPIILSHKRVHLFIIIGNVNQFIVHCLIP